jgi:hypothetical protein
MLSTPDAVTLAENWPCPRPQDTLGARLAAMVQAVWPHRIPTSPGLPRWPPQNTHGQDGTTRHSAARLLAWPR